MTFEQFYKETFSIAYKFFYYKSVNASYIEDLCQDSYLRFYQKFINKLDNSDESIKILYGICRNVYREWIRTRINEINGFEEDWFNNETEEEDEIEFTAEYEKTINIQKQTIRKEIKNLNDTVRKVIEYRFIEGLSRKETASKLGISETDVHTYQKRGVKYLYKKINGDVPRQS